MKPANTHECERMHCLDCDYSKDMFRLDKEECRQRDIFKNCLGKRRDIFINNRRKNRRNK